MPQLTPSGANGRHAIALRALLRASRELGPTMEDELVATYLAQHAPVEPRRGIDLALLARQLPRARFVPAAILAANLGGTALVQHIVVSSNPWDWRFGTEVAATLSLLAVLNFTLGAVLGLVVAGIRATGMEAWRATRQLRRMLLTASAGSTVIALVDWHWASMNGQDPPPGDLLTPLTIAFAVVLVLALLTLVLRPLPRLERRNPIHDFHP